MSRLKRNPLTPASLAADGMQGASARACGRCHAKHSPQAVATLFLARLAIEAAQAQLESHALATDNPHPGTVEAADLLDAAAQRLAQIGHAIKGARGGDA